MSEAPIFKLEKGQPILDGVPLMSVRALTIELNVPGNLAEVTLYLDAVIVGVEMPANVKVIRDPRSVVRRLRRVRLITKSRRATV